MKYIYKIFALFLLVSGVISCDDNVSFDILPSQNSLAILTPTNGSIIVLDDTNPNNNALFISWSTADGSDTGAFTLEVAKTGTSFAAPFVLGTSQTTNFNMTVVELNTFLLETMNLNPEEANSLDIRVLSNGKVSLVVSVIVTPFIIEVPEIFLVGSMTNPAWAAEGALPLTRLDFNIFEITIDLADGDEFKFIPTNTNLDIDWGEDPDNPGTLIKDGDVNFKGFTAGKYKLTLNFNTFTFTVEEIVAPDNLFLVGSLTGWDPAQSLPFLNDGNNVFTVVIDLPAGAEFKFLPTNTSFDGDWGVDPNNAGGIVQDGEQNVSGFSSGKYLVTVDYNTLNFKLDPIDNLFLVGSLTGWDPGTALPMTSSSLGVFSIIVDLPAGAEFKFLPTNTSFDGDWGADPTNAGALIQNGESNLGGFSQGQQVIAFNYNTLTYTVSSISGVPAELYLVGAFNGWTNDLNDPQFTETSSGVFEITQALSAGDEFKFVPVAGDWNNDWGENSAHSGVLEQNSEQNLSVADADTYKITVNFNDGTIALETAVAAPLDSKYMVGAGVPTAGWAWDTPVEMTQATAGVWSATTTFANDAFRFFDINGDWGSGSNYPFYADDGYTIDSNLENALDGDSNFKFLGTPGEYIITLNSNNKTITLEVPVAPLDSKYMVGAGVPTAGWAWDTPVEMTQATAGVWSATTTFANDAFRFFDINGDWGSGSNYPFYADAGYTIDSNLENALDGDSNFKFNGTPGEYTITLDSNNKTITMVSTVTLDPKYMVGAGVPDAGWAWDTPIEMTQTSVGVWSATTTFANDAFRFFDINGDWGSGSNYPFYADAGYTIDDRLEDALDGDNNFKFIGASGEYTITLDSNNKTITLVAIP